MRLMNICRQDCSGNEDKHQGGKESVRPSARGAAVLCANKNHGEDGHGRIV